MFKPLSHNNNWPQFKIGSLVSILIVAMGGGDAHAQGSANDNCQYEVMPYLWATAMKEGVQAGQLPRTSVDMKFSDIVDVMDSVS